MSSHMHLLYINYRQCKSVAASKCVLHHKYMFGVYYIAKGVYIVGVQAANNENHT